MVHELDQYVSVEIKYDIFELQFKRDVLKEELTDEESLALMLGINPTRIKIKDEWYDVIHPRTLYYSERPSDGSYHVVYMQINRETGEYYIGKANRKTWKELRRYHGSGIRFTNEFNKHKGCFIRYYIASCETAEETEELEAELVDEVLLSSDKCLNLVCGGGGTNNHPSTEETKEKKRQWMLNHPEQMQAMIQATKKEFSSGDTPALKKRSQSIKKTMQTDYYRKQFRDRIKKWREDNPEKFTDALARSKASLNQPVVQEKKKETFRKWVEEHKDEYTDWQKRLIDARKTEEALAKKSESLKRWNQNHPEACAKRAQAAAKKRSKAVCMIDRNSGEVIKEFNSQHDAARWLVEQGIAKNVNCVSSISEVCKQKTTKGHKIKKQAYGYGWCFKKRQINTH